MEQVKHAGFIRDVLAERGKIVGATIEYAHDLADTFMKGIGPDFFMVGILIDGELYTDNVVVRSKDGFKPAHGDAVDFYPADEATPGAFPLVVRTGEEPTEQKEEAAA